MAGAILAHRLAGVPDLNPVRSAGLLAGGRPADPDAVAAVSRLGLDIAAHRSRQLDAGMVADATLVLGMERRHVREAVLLAPAAWPRAFTLKELVRRGRRAGPRRPGEPLADWLARAAGDRTTADLLGDSPDDDVADPIGRAGSYFRRTAAELGGLADELAALLLG